MKFVVRKLALTLFAGLCAFAQPVAAQSIGDRVTCTATAFACSPASATVGSAVEFIYAPFLNLDFSTNLLTVTSRQPSIQFGNGVSISFRDTTNAFTGATLLTNTNSNVVASDIVYNGGLITLNLSNRMFTGTTGQLTIGTLATAVPEPAGWAMMILGFGVAGFALRRQRRAPADVRFS